MTFSLSFHVLVFVLPFPYLCPSMSLTLYFHALSFSFHALVFVLPWPCLCTSTSDTSLTWLVSDLFHSLVHATDLHDPIFHSPCGYFVFSSSMFLLLSISKLCPSISLCYTFVRCLNCYHYLFNPCFYNLPTLIFPVPNPKSFVHCSRCYHYLFHLSFFFFHDLLTLMFTVPNLIISADHMTCTSFYLFHSRQCCFPNPNLYYRLVTNLRHPKTR